MPELHVAIAMLAMLAEIAVVSLPADLATVPTWVAKNSCRGTWQSATTLMGACSRCWMQQGSRKVELDLGRRKQEWAKTWQGWRREQEKAR